jgi:hypothetical protein
VKLSLDVNNDTTIGYADDTLKQGDAASGNKRQFAFWQSQNTGNAVDNDLMDFAAVYLHLTLAFCEARSFSPLGLHHELRLESGINVI